MTSLCLQSYKLKDNLVTKWTFASEFMMLYSPSYPQRNAVYWITDECSNTTKKSLMKTDLKSEDNKKGNVNEGEMDW